MKKLLLALLFLVLILAFARLWQVRNWKDYNVEGDSMLPTYSNGDTVITSTIAKPAIGDVIVFDCFSKCPKAMQPATLMKRLIQIDSSGNIWVEGDNKSASYDSRTFGWLSTSDIKIDGVVIK